MGYKDHIYTDSLVSNRMNADFIGVKIGDVNQSAEVRSSDYTLLSSSVDEVMEGEVFEIGIVNSSNQDIEGLQLSLQLDKVELVSFESEMFVLDNTNMSISNDLLSIVLHEVKNKKAFDVLSFKLRAIDGGFVEDLVTIDNSKLKAEVYQGKVLESSDIVLESIEKEENDFYIYQNVPNPYRYVSQIDFRAPLEDISKLTIRDVTGRIVYEEYLNTQIGKNTFLITEDKVTVPGVYYYTIELNEMTQTRKMVYIR